MVLTTKAGFFMERLISLDREGRIETGGVAREPYGGVEQLGQLVSLIS